MAFEAQYDGMCTARCGRRIHPGDLIVRTDDGYRHADDTDPAPDLTVRPDEKPCEACWLFHPEGACTA